MKQTAILFLVIFLQVQSCSAQEFPAYTLTDVHLTVDIDSLHPVDIDVEHVERSFVFTNVHYVPLETNRDCMIGTINKVLIRDNRMYVADFNQTLTLFVFDMNGRFLFKITRIGKGPGEYISFRDFDVHTNGDIYMFDHFGKKFLVFSPAGQYLREFKSDYIFSYFSLVGDKIYLANFPANGKKFAELAVYDPKSGKTEFLLKDKKILLGLGLSRSVAYRFYHSPPGITYYAPRFSEIIYSIDDQGIHPAIGIKNLLMPPEHVIREWESKGLDVHDVKSMDRDQLYFKENMHVYETDSYITFKCVNKSPINYMTVVYDKYSRTFSSIMIYLFHVHLGIDGIKGSTGKNFFSVMNPHTDNKDHQQILKSRKELASWKEEDNPVIVFFDLDI